jgi:mono/diheme cytochrome c family protein
MIKKCLHMKRLVVVFVLASPLLGQTVGTKDVPVTAVQGESWLSHLHRPFAESGMGRTWELGPPPPEPWEAPPSWELKLSPNFLTPVATLHGSDLYRMNCQGCHKADGEGLPPEINSVINPVRATSAVILMARLKAAGREMSRKDAVEIAKQSMDLLLQRLHNGGEEMPKPNLSEAEIHSLVVYLEQLADIPGAETKQIEVKVSAYRVGEHIVKSTCHICHSTTGPNPSPQQISNGSIPPLSILTKRVGMSGFVRKVTEGAPIMMGMPAMYHRGRMPVFVYLSEDEAADAYLYLTLYPPHQ